MNYLKTDEQTLNDLAIFNKPGKNSVYQLYNKAVTQGGSARIAELFKAPLSDEKAINERVALYSFFSKNIYQFPVESVTVGVVDYYMKNEDVRSQIQLGEQSISHKLKNMVATDADYIFVEDGVKATLRVFEHTEIFLNQFDSKALSVFSNFYTKLKDILSLPDFEILKKHIDKKSKGRLNDVHLSELDKLIRFKKRAAILSLLDMLYDLDVFITIGQIAREKNFHFAKALPKDTNTISYKQVFHPHIENAIANNLEMDASHNVLFLTGANMAGKSTLMKSVGIALYLGHMGFPVAAKELRFSVRDGIFSNINLADNLNAGASHYYAEVLRVKEVASRLKAGKKLFVIFDELFRGTNVKDAYDATVALVRAFTYKGDSQFIISTHIMEAGEALQQEKLSIQYQYLPTTMKDNTPIYTRVLKEGITADRQGMVIIENEGILLMLDKGLIKT